MKKYTVFGVYDSGQTYAGGHEGETHFDAIKAAALDVSGDSELIIIGAVEGEHVLFGVACDNDNSAYACDLTGEEDLV